MHAILLFALACAMLSVNGSGPESIAARVNGVPITVAEFRDALRLRYEPIALKDILEERLLEQEARRLKIRIDESAINRLVASRIGLESTKVVTNVPFEVKTIRRLMRRLWLIDAISRKRTNVSDSEINAYYESHKSLFIEPKKLRLRIMVLDTKDNAEQLHILLKEGGNFEELTKTFSTDPVSRGQGGDLGDMSLEAIAPPLREVAEKMQIGDISDPIPMADEWHIIKLVARAPERQKSLNEVKLQIRAQLFQEKLPMTRYSLLRTLRANSHIDMKR